MTNPSITLLSFGYFRKEFLEKVADDVSREFSCDVHLRDGHLDLSEFYDPGRRQYNGNSLLKEVDTAYASEDVKLLGLFSVDLYIPILTFIFGQAMLNGRTGIASVYRLGNERYGLAKDEDLLMERFSKEVIHELGHMFGLIHCHTTGCVMRSSTYVEDIDQKEIHLCTNCRTLLNGSNGFQDEG
jgi:archaemetzincin